MQLLDFILVIAGTLVVCFTFLALLGRGVV